jgi:hypothetical protein
MIIEGGTGNGYKVKVDEYNRLWVRATAESALHHESVEHGNAYAWTAVSADIDTGDTAILVCNDDPDKRLIIDHIFLWTDVAAQFKIHVPAYAAFDGTAIVGVNLNRTSNKIALATAKADDAQNAFVAANTILTVHTNELATDTFAVEVDMKNALVLGYHDTVAVDIIGESAAFEATIWGYYTEV